MNGRERRAIGMLLGALFGATAAQAQDVHKCTINGAVSYQSTPCPSGDVVLQTPPTPSDQEQRQARSDQYRQQFQAATGRIFRPVPVPPPPPTMVAGTTTTTTIIVSQGPKHVIIRQVRSGPPTPAPKPLTNCEQLNQDNEEAQDRHTQLRAPSELASHDELLKKSEADIGRIAQLASASHCTLKH